MASADEEVLVLGLSRLFFLYMFPSSLLISLSNFFPCLSYSLLLSVWIMFRLRKGGCAEV